MYGGFCCFFSQGDGCLTGLSLDNYPRTQYLTQCEDHLMQLEKRSKTAAVTCTIREPALTLLDLEKEMHSTRKQMQTIFPLLRSNEDQEVC